MLKNTNLVGFGGGGVSVVPGEFWSNTAGSSTFEIPAYNTITITIWGGGGGGDGVDTDTTEITGTFGGDSQWNSTAIGSADVLDAFGGEPGSSSGAGYTGAGGTASGGNVANLTGQDGQEDINFEYGGYGGNTAGIFTYVNTGGDGGGRGGLQTFNADGAQNGFPGTAPGGGGGGAYYNPNGRAGDGAGAGGMARSTWTTVTSGAPTAGITYSYDIGAGGIGGNGNGRDGGDGGAGGIHIEWE